MAANATNGSDTSGSCTMFPEHPGYCETLVICKRVSASVSIIGTIFVLFIIVFFKRYQYFSQRLVANLCLGSLVLSISFILTDFHETSTPICIAQGAMVMFSLSCVCGWMMVIMANLYSMTFYDRSLQRFEKPLTLFFWLLPVVFMVVPFAGHDVYGPAGVWCWMNNDWGWRIGFWYILRIASVLMFLIVSIRIIYHLIKMARINSANVTDFYATHDEVRTLRMYPIVYFLVNICSFINRIQNSVSGANQSGGYVFGLILLQCLTEPFVGGALALTFVLNKQTLQTLTLSRLKEAFQVRWNKSDGAIMEYHVFD